MNYAGHYQRLIDRARGRNLDGYRERHHVIPRCMGGTNAAANIVELTAAEHYVAHQLLAKMHPERPGLLYAAVRMAKQCTGSRAFSWLRIRAAHASAIKFANREFSDEHRKRISNALVGRKLSDETRRKLSNSKRGVGVHSEAHLSALSVKMKGNSYAKGAVRSAEFKRHLSELWTGKRKSPETREKMSLAQIGNDKWKHRDVIKAIEAPFRGQPLK